MGKFDGKVAIITGGGRGQGRSHAEALAAEGADIVVVDIEKQNPNVPYEMNSPGDLAETVRLVEKHGGRCLAITADVRDHDAMQGVADTALSEFGRIDILVANAGVATMTPIVDTSFEAWSSVIDTNLSGIFNSIKAVAPHMIERNYGRIIAIASVMGRFGTQNLAPYTASKWGIIGLVKSAAREFGPHCITVNAINPAVIDTGMVRNDTLRRLFVPGKENPTDEDVDHVILSTGTQWIPKARLDPSEVSKAVLFLASDDAAYISGGTLDVSAGQAANYT